MSITTELIVERIYNINTLLESRLSDAQRTELIVERDRLTNQLHDSNTSLQEGKQLLKG